MGNTRWKKRKIKTTFHGEYIVFSCKTNGKSIELANNLVSKQNKRKLNQAHYYDCKF